MKKLPKVYIVGENHSVANWLGMYRIVTNPTEADLAIFTGGADVSPHLYDEKPLSGTLFDVRRDAKEISYYEIFKGSDIRMMGICRGAQFLTVMEGGRLIQDVTGHTKSHKMVFGDKVLEISSTHHQMMYPFDLRPETYKIHAYTEGLSNHYLTGLGTEDPEVEPEIVQYGDDVLCIQGHPEYLSYQHSTNIELRNLFGEFINHDDYLQ